MAAGTPREFEPRWKRMVETLGRAGFTYEVPIERVEERDKGRWVQVEIAGHRLLVPAGEEAKRQTQVGEVRLLFLHSSFFPASLHPDLRDHPKGFSFFDTRTNEFSAKGEIVRTIDDWAVLDCGFFIVVQLDLHYFQKEGGGPPRRELRAGDIVIETGALSAILL